MTKEKDQSLPAKGRFQIFFEAAFEGIGIAEAGRVVDVNDRLAEMLGYGRGELIGQPVMNLVAAEDRGRVGQMMRDGVDGIYSHRSVRKDGSTFPVEVQGRSMEVEGRQVRVTAIRDVSEREAATSRIRESTDRLSLLTKAVESSNEVVFLTDSEGVFTYVNPAFTQLYGWEAEEVIGLETPRILKSGIHGEAYYKEMWAILGAGKVLEGEFKNKRRSGEVVDISASANPVLNDSGEIIGFLAIQSDISARKIHEETLLNIARGVSGSTGETFFRDLATNLCLAVGAQTAIIGRVSGQEGEVIETLAVEVQGEVRENFTYPVHGAPCEKALAEGVCIESSRVQERFPLDLGLQRLGAEAYVGKALTDSAGDAMGVALVLFNDPVADPTLAVSMLEIFASRATVEMERDRAEGQRIRLEEQLRQAQKMEEIGQLTGGIAHDFQNLLSVILLNTELMRESVEEGQGVTVAEVREIEEAAQQAANMTRKLLGFGRRADLSLVPTDLGPVVRGMSSMLRRVIPENIDVRIRVPEGLGRVKADPGAVEQILLNLATNARDAMPGGGALSVELRAVSLGPEEVKSIPGSAEGTFLALRVADTGVGMDEAVCNRVFEPFFTTKPVGEGTGLGLAMVFGLAQQHGGFLHIESEPGVGTSVSLFLPLAAHQSTSAVPGGLRPAVVGGDETLLVVEDQAALRRTLKLVLERVGYSVLMAEDGQEGLEIAAEKGDQIHLIISDLVMPRLGGVELFHRLRKAGRDTRFIMTSGYAGKSASGLAELDPSVPVLKKPWKPGDLLHLVREVLDRE